VKLRGQSKPWRRGRALVTIELVVALGILASTMLPVAFSFAQEQRLARAYYFRAIAIELVDGEMERLLAGEWQAFSMGRHPYKVHGEAQKNLPTGEFVLSIQNQQLRLEWRPAKHSQGGVVSRVAPIPAPGQKQAVHYEDSSP